MSMRLLIEMAGNMYYSNNFNHKTQNSNHQRITVQCFEFYAGKTSLGENL